ncbi:MAG: AMP-binding protein [Neisseriaceae bacterium]|nr:MAG: AMP-binding protein [Neisseriaceae bacterium]
MEKIWFKSYPKSIKREINVDDLGTIVDMFKRSAKQYANNPAYTSIRTTLTFAQAEELVDNFSSFLQNILKVEKGERIAIMMPNVLQYPIAVFGALQAGMVVVNINPLYTAPEVQAQLIDSEASTIVVLENFASTFEKIADTVPVKHVIVAKIGDLLHSFWGFVFNFAVKNIAKGVPSYKLSGHIAFKEAIALGKKTSFRPVDLRNTDLAFLQYTGGTTGIPKGAMLTHRNICANIAQASEWISLKLKPGSECIVTALPLYHIFSLTVNLMIFTSIGGHNILIVNPRDMKNFIKQLKNKKYNITAISCVNTLFNALVNQSEFKKIDFSSWKISLGGGAAVQKDVADKWNQITGLPIIEAYGLTEASPGVCVNPVTIEQYTGYVGLPIPSTDIQIRDKNGEQLGIGEVGDLWVRGPQVMLGYWNRPEETEKVLKDGWLDTGDIAYVNEEGFVKLVDRKKDMIIISGFNVYPNEVEDVLMMNPGILECSVIGVPSEKTGEALKVFIVKSDPNLTEEEVIQFARRSLTSYKIPKIIEFRDELPKSNIGKILRRVLHEEEMAKLKIRK